MVEELFIWEEDGLKIEPVSAKGWGLRRPRIDHVVDGDLPEWQPPAFKCIPRSNQFSGTEKKNTTR